jgi:hypothetical protein
MGDAFSKEPPRVRAHVEKALAAAGPHPTLSQEPLHPGQRRCPVARLLAASVGALKGALALIFRLRGDKLDPRVVRRRHGNAVIYLVPASAEAGKLLVVSPGRCGRDRDRLESLVSLAISRGWSVAVDDAKPSDADTVMACLRSAERLLARQRDNASSDVSPALSRTCLVGLASGARAACKAAVSCKATSFVPLVAIPDGSDTEPDFWVDYAQAPALIVDVPGEKHTASELAAKDSELVAAVEAPPRDRRGAWANTVALEFLDSAIRP